MSATKTGRHRKRKPTANPDADVAGPSLAVTSRIGRISRLELAVALNVTTRTIDRWIREGVSGAKLACDYVGDRVWFEWDDIRAWQTEVRRRRLGDAEAIEATKPRRVSEETKRVLERNGYKVGDGV